MVPLFLLDGVAMKAALILIGGLVLGLSALCALTFTFRRLRDYEELTHSEMLRRLDGLLPEQQRRRV